MDLVTQAAALELARRRLLPFARHVNPRFEAARHIRKMVDALEALERRDIDKLLIVEPPRHGKSQLCSRIFPAFWLGRRPSDQIVLASYGATLAESNSRAVRGIVAGDTYPFETRVSPESSAVDHWETTAGGVVTAVGRGGALTGQGAHLLALDDLIKDREEADSPAIRESAWSWYGDVAKTRLMPKAAQLFVGTIWHEDDPIGRLLNSDDAKYWTTLILPGLAAESDPLGRSPGEALWPERFDVEYFEDMRRTMSARSFSAIYLCRPVPAEGHIFKEAWLGQRYAPGSLPEDARIIQAIDGAWKTGVSNDFSVIATWAATRTHFYLVNVWRQRVEFPTLKAAVRAQHDLFHPHEIIVEDAASGIAVVQSLRSETNLPIIPIQAKGSKESRADAVTPLFESGRVLLPDVRAPWLDVWIDEHLRFPTGAHDDQVDTTSLALARLRHRPVAEWSFAIARNR